MSVEVDFFKQILLTMIMQSMVYLQFRHYIFHDMKNHKASTVYLHTVLFKCNETWHGCSSACRY